MHKCAGFMRVLGVEGVDSGFHAASGLECTWRSALRVQESELLSGCGFAVGMALLSCYGEWSFLQRGIRSRLFGSSFFPGLIWAFVKIRVSFWVLTLIWHLLFRVPKKGP